MKQNGVVLCYFMYIEFADFRLIFYNVDRNFMLSLDSIISIASDDNLFKSHK